MDPVMAKQSADAPCLLPLDVALPPPLCRFRLRLDPVMAEAVCDHLREKVLTDVAEAASAADESGGEEDGEGTEGMRPPVSTKRGQSGGERTGRAPLSTRGGQGRSSSAAAPRQASWVPRVYSASAEELVDLVGSLAWLGVR